MKISFPKNKRKVVINGGKLYLIFGRSIQGDFWLMDFWGFKYTFKSYKDAVKGSKIIEKKMKHYGWEDTKPLIMKIQF